MFWITLISFLTSIDNTHRSTGRARLIGTRLIRSFEVSLKSLPDSYHFVLKCTVNSNTVNLKFHQFEGNLTVV